MWRTVLPEKPTSKPGDEGSAGGRQSYVTEKQNKRPRCIYESVTFDPDKAGLQVAKIAEEILFELTRILRKKNPLGG